MIASVLIFAACALLAYTNGANDISKSVATLVGSGVTNHTRAVQWGAIWTALGAAIAAVTGSAMLKTFGSDFVTADATGSVAARAVAVLLGAVGWIALATRTGLPVSTTHALISSLVGVTWLARGPEVIHWHTLLGKISLPLLLSPLLAFGLASLIVRVGRRDRSAQRADCLCVDVVPLPVASSSSAAMMSALPALALNRAPAIECLAKPGHVLALTVDRMHWLSSGATAFARGLNDAPKLVALAAAGGLLFTTSSHSLMLIFGLVASGMVAGSLIAGRRVTEVLAMRVTAMNHADGFIANGVTSVLVTVGAVWGLPMSTTHVSSGAIFAIGANQRTLNAHVVRDILLAWVVTLPASALIGMGAAKLLAALAL